MDNPFSSLSCSYHFPQPFPIYLPSEPCWSSFSNKFISLNFKVDLGGDAAVPRHSHTACAWNNHVVLAGGLDASLHALDAVQIIDIQVRK